MEGRDAALVLHPSRSGRGDLRRSTWACRRPHRGRSDHHLARSRSCVRALCGRRLAAAEDAPRTPHAARGTQNGSLTHHGGGWARPPAHVFVPYGLRAGFIDDLRGAVTRFEQSVANRLEARRTHVTARAAIDAGLTRSFVIVRHL